MDELTGSQRRTLIVSGSFGTDKAYQFLLPARRNLETLIQLGYLTEDQEGWIRFTDKGKKAVTDAGF